VRIPDSTGRTAPNQFDSSALPEVRSHFHHKRVGLKRGTEVHGGYTEYTGFIDKSFQALCSPQLGAIRSREAAPEVFMFQFLSHLWMDEEGQDIAEYAVMLAVILVLVIGTVELIGSNANTVFSQVASNIQ
jgi:pilus assembly protein Flp/PilA